MKRTKITIVALALTVALLASALGALLIEKQLSNSMHIQAVGDFAIQKANGTPVSSVAWGVFYPGDSKNSSSILGSYIILKAIGSITLAFTWRATGLDRSQWNISCTWNGALHVPFPENSYQFSIVPPDENGWLDFRLSSLNLTNTVEQDLGFTITITAIQA